MSGSFLRRVTPLINGHIRRNQRLLCAAAVSRDPVESLEAVHMTESCIRRMKDLQAKEASSGGNMLRLSVETGGCSGFQYVFLLDDNKNEDDRVFEKDGVKLVVDKVSYDFVKGATVDYVEELIRSAFMYVNVDCLTFAYINTKTKVVNLLSAIFPLYFEVTTNPSAVGGCSCKSSFMVK